MAPLTKRPERSALRFGAASFTSRAKAGGADKDRTCDLLNAIQALYQLSYDPNQSAANLITAPRKSIR